MSSVTGSSADGVQTVTGSTASYSRPTVVPPRAYISKGNYYLVTESNGRLCWLNSYQTIQDYVRLFPTQLTDSGKSFLKIPRVNIGEISTNLSKIRSLSVSQPGFIDLGLDGRIPYASHHAGNCSVVNLFKYHIIKDPTVRAGEAPNNTVKAAYGSPANYFCDLGTFQDILDYHRVFRPEITRVIADYLGLPDGDFHKIPFTELGDNAKYTGTCAAAAK